MACNPFFLIFLVLCAAAAAVRSQANLSYVTVSGKLCCTPSGNCPGRDLAGADVTLFYEGHSVAQNTTNMDGDISIKVHYSYVSNSTLVVDLPIDNQNCSVLYSASGYLKAHVEFHGYSSTLQISSWSRS